MDCMLWEIALASLVSVRLHEMSWIPASPAAGAAPETPRLLLPTAAATPAAAVPWAFPFEGAGLLSMPQWSGSRLLS